MRFGSIWNTRRISFPATRWPFPGSRTIRNWPICSPICTRRRNRDAAIARRAMDGATIIDGKAIAARLRQQIAEAAASLRGQHGITPGLGAVLVGEDPASQIYVRSKARACAAAGVASFEHHWPADCGPAAVVELVHQLNSDERVDGILVQLPLPPAIDRHAVIAAIDPAKDVDGFHPVNVGRLWNGEPGLVPCTPEGCMMLLRSVHPDLSGMEAVVLGRSQIVGRPVAALLLAADCTVTMVHSKTRDAAAIYRLPILERESAVMLSKTTASLAFAAACLTLATIPVAQAQYYTQPQVLPPQVETNGRRPAGAISATGRRAATSSKASVTTGC